MMEKIDVSEVLHHLRKFGIRSIDEEALKQFMKDLKKLIKYDRMKKEGLITQSPSQKHCQSGDTCIQKVQLIHNGSSCLSDRTSRLNGVGSSNSSNLTVKTCTQCDGCLKKKPEASSNSELFISSSSYSRPQLIKKKKRNDPVELYHYYQSIWKHCKLPGENDHAELRQSVRTYLKDLK